MPRQVFIAVCERQEAILFVFLGFMNAANSPFSGSSQAAAYALSAGYGYRSVVGEFSPNERASAYMLEARSW